ncbi:MULTISPECIES: hypothetical protein [Stenotrophomonas]|uniref:hypothetical protein n=1 Tax=Stenotrophomonas TaxID=40323 RepID=UPI0012FD118B|nr:MULTISPECIES: hypothetical protein [Stenotrophomonas]HDS1145069.1 hypothetical protein [Stenotrophomonas maltophilia]HDS1159939.1 hypothetical protein [Stenotrophomonas maltophilia]
MARLYKCLLVCCFSATPLEYVAKPALGCFSAANGRPRVAREPSMARLYKRPLVCCSSATRLEHVAKG